jgi:hypothetical protein
MLPRLWSKKSKQTMCENPETERTIHRLKEGQYECHMESEGERCESWYWMESRSNRTLLAMFRVLFFILQVLVTIHSDCSKWRVC